MASSKDDKIAEGSSRLSDNDNKTGSNSLKRTLETRNDTFGKREKIAFGLSRPPGSAKKPGGFQMKLNPVQKTPASVQPLLNKPPAAIFTESDDDEPEEMPPEAKMRMRNIGRDTPTSAGPNSFGKTKQGFCNRSMQYDKALKNDAEQIVGLHRELRD